MIEVVVGNDVFEVGESGVVIGRSLSCDIQVSDPRVSREHVELRYANGQWTLSDRSSGGTWHRGTAIDDVVVERRMTVRLGTEGAPDITIRPVLLGAADETVLASPQAIADALAPRPPAAPTTPTSALPPTQPTPPSGIRMPPQAPAGFAEPPSSAVHPQAPAAPRFQPGHQPVASQPHPQMGLAPNGEAAKKPFYKKKRVLIPSGLAALVVAVSVGGGSSSNSDPDGPAVTAVAAVAEANDSEPGSEADVDAGSDSAPDEPAVAAAETETVSSSRTSPFAMASPVAVKWDVFGDADDSIWNTSIGIPADITQSVLEENQFNDPPEDGFTFIGFDVAMTLAQAQKEPLSLSFNGRFEVVGGATAGAYDEDCGVVSGEFDAFDEVFAGGTVSGTVCISVPTEDLGHPDTQVSINFGGSREYFGAVGTATGVAEIIPSDPTSAELEAGGRFNPLPVNSATQIVWDVFGDADQSTWLTTMGAAADITRAVLDENQFNDPPPEGYAFVGFPVELTLESAEKEPLSVGFNAKFEIVGGATAAVYSDDCGVIPQEFDLFAEVFIGGTLQGTVCIVVPVEDLGHPDTRSTMRFDEDTRAYFQP